ncbi:hypothetical protein HC256_007631 [Beauveria bassiana]|nr:hypothetical protein HC256_007631 [Beauveria bassiana]
MKSQRKQSRARAKVRCKRRRDARKNCDAAPKEAKAIMKKCPFLQQSMFVRMLHSHAIWEVASHLTLVDQLWLSRTCKDLNEIMRYALRRNARHSFNEDVLEALAVLASEQIDKWACGQCRKLHLVNYQDTPHPSASWTSHVYKPDLFSVPDHSSYSVGHHHVQLTLKYSRRFLALACRRAYLQDLLKQSRQWISSGDLQTICTMTPRVLKGRYLRKSEWMILSIGRHLTYRMVGTVTLCCHLLHLPGICETSPLSTTMAKVLSEGSAPEIYCYFCATEFTVKLSSYLGKLILLIEAYQDLGGEGSICEKNWKALAWDNRSVTYFAHCVLNKLTNRRSVREMWERKPLPWKPDDGWPPFR